MKPKPVWSYGITTVPERKDDLFPRTLESLAKAGFNEPRLFIDNCEDPTPYKHLGLELTTRCPRIRTAGNWWLSLWELYIRVPNANFFALFQDDLVTSPGLREYLEHCDYSPKSYWNLYTFPVNQALIPPGKTGWFPSNQMGKGAVALVFDREAVMALLGDGYLVDRFQSKHRGHKAIDGAIVSCLRLLKWRELCHNPSLVQHTGKHSSMGNALQQRTESFCGETFNVTELLRPEPT